MRTHKSTTRFQTSAIWPREPHMKREKLQSKSTSLVVTMETQKLCWEKHGWIASPWSPQPPRHPTSLHLHVNEIVHAFLISTSFVLKSHDWIECTFKNDDVISTRYKRYWKCIDGRISNVPTPTSSGNTCYQTNLRLENVVRPHVYLPTSQW